MAKNEHHEMLAAWLKDAYSMEKGIEPVLENHAKDAGDGHPRVRERIDRHLEETRRHADIVKSCLDRLGEQPSTMKTGIGKVMGGMQSVATGGAKDELVKNALQDYATEHMEIASYRALIAAAEEVNQPEIAEACRTILRDEEDMARWLEESLPMTVREALHAQATARV